MTTSDLPSTPGAFLQLIEYRTEQPEEMAAILQRWIDAIGARRTTRWYITAADRDRPGVFVQLVEFPSYAAAMANSDHPATAEFATALAKASIDELVFRNLDVVVAQRL